MTVGELVATMSNREFVEWHAWHSVKSSKERLAQKMAKNRGR